MINITLLDNEPKSAEEINGTVLRARREKTLLFVAGVFCFPLSIGFFINYIYEWLSKGGASMPLTVLAMLGVVGLIIFRLDLMADAISDLRNADDASMDAINALINKEEIGPKGLAYLEAMIRTGRKIPTAAEANTILAEAEQIRQKNLAAIKHAAAQKRRDDLVAGITEYSHSKGGN